jgi:periplasmic glucans biosynthesis protein
MTLLSLISVAPAALAQATQKQITFDYVLHLARERASKPFRPPQSDLPEQLRGDKLNYDTYRQIQFKHDKALWTSDNSPFRLEFFHPGYLYQVPVKINEFNSTHVQPIRFVQDFFNYGNLKIDKRIPADVGYAGFKLLYRLNDPNRWDEVASFLGSSYFRMLGQGQRYGSSARGLALNSGETDRKEEFPIFTEWWLAKPEKGNDTLHCFGLLESASCAGAYEFLIRPGETTFADVTAVVFMREGADVKTFGVAPLTSMFWFGETSESKTDDYRPEVHDTDGLLIRTEQDEFTWRPLHNPAALQHQVFTNANIRGFGLLQRDRNFANYQDIFNLYHQVPSIWVEPRGNWGAGEVHLIELPTNFEGADNIVAFWNPKEKPRPGQEFKFAYTLHWALRPDAKFAPCKVSQTRFGKDPGDQSKRQVVIDFDGSESLPLASQIPKVDVTASPNAAISHVQVFKNEIGKTWRVIFSLSPKANDDALVDIRCALNAGGRVVSERWNYQWKPLSNKSK